MNVINTERIRQLNNSDRRVGDYVVYWMQASQRYTANLALAFAIGKANALKLPLIVYFEILPHFPEANQRHLLFMLEGLGELSEKLQNNLIKFIITVSAEPLAKLRLLLQKAACAITDKGYLKFARRLRKELISKVDCPFYEIESDIVIPVQSTSPKEEYSAATIRRKILRRFADFVFDQSSEALLQNSLQISCPLDNDPDYLFLKDAFSIRNYSAIISRYNIDTSVDRSNFLTGGETQAERSLTNFLNHLLEQYADKRNQPALHICSNLSPYLHYGQISPILTARLVMEHAYTVSHEKRHLQKPVSQENTGTFTPKQGFSSLEDFDYLDANAEAFLEELVVRRELSLNFVYYNDRYHEFSCLPQWAIQTLYQHINDNREYSYPTEQLENASTHDPYWNAAQQEMVLTGKMQNYMRMYWGKKILEWNISPEEAFNTVVFLNNKYSLDGRDPNSYAGIAWCFGKHDRSWFERSIFGKVRYMNSNGLNHKFDMSLYINKIKKLKDEY